MYIIVFFCPLNSYIYVYIGYWTLSQYYYFQSSVFNACGYLGVHLLILICCVELVNHLPLFSEYIFFGRLTIFSNYTSSLLYSSAFDFTFFLSSILRKLSYVIHLCLAFTYMLGNVLIAESVNTLTKLL